jgi:pimeloyl-ACP methyl ester carboxylesterase
LYYLTNGEAELPALILIHGAGGSSAVWPYQLRRLPGWRVLAADLPGHGGSTLAAERTLNAYAARMLERMDAMGIAQAVLCGHSMGAAIAMEMALHEPKAVRGLVLLGAAAAFTVNQQLLEKFSVPLRLQEGVNMMVRWSFARTADETLRKTYTRQLLACPQGLLLKDMQACAAFSLGERAKQLGQPSLILSGEEDVMVAPRLSQALAESLARATYRGVAGAGHMLMQEKPDETVAELEPVLQGWKAKDH